MLAMWLPAAMTMGTSMVGIQSRLKTYLGQGSTAPLSNPRGLGSISITTSVHAVELRELRAVELLELPLENLASVARSMLPVPIFTPLQHTF
jgi:hypothetical protein